MHRRGVRISKNMTPPLACGGRNYESERVREVDALVAFLVEVERVEVPATEKIPEEEGRMI